MLRVNYKKVTRNHHSRKVIGDFSHLENWKSLTSSEIMPVVHRMDLNKANHKQVGQVWSIKMGAVYILLSPARTQQNNFGWRSNVYQAVWDHATRLYTQDSGSMEHLQDMTRV